MQRRRLTTIVLGAGLIVALVASGIVLHDSLRQARAQGYTVDDDADAVDAVPGDGRCETSGGACTLRAAIMEANKQPFPSTITLAGDEYFLTIEGIDDNAEAGDLDIRQSMTLRCGSTITSVQFDHLFEVHDAVLHHPRCHITRNRQLRTRWGRHP